MNYATLQEAYNEESFDKKKKIPSKEKNTFEPSNNDEYFKKLNELENNNPNKKKKVKKQEVITPSYHNIEPYYDEELDKYLNMNNFNKKLTEDITDLKIENNKIEEDKISSIQNNKTFKENYNNSTNPTNPTDKQKKIIENYHNPYQSNLTKKDIFYKNLINIGLFIFIGILIIFICEQITEIAINIGMRRAIILLEPYLNKP